MDPGMSILYYLYQKSLHFYQRQQCRASSARTYDTNFTSAELLIPCQQTVFRDQMGHPVQL